MAKLVCSKIAFDVTGMQYHPHPSHRPNETATDHDVLSDHIAFYLRIFAENERSAMNVAINLPINAEGTVRGNVARSSPIFEDPGGLEFRRVRLWVCARTYLAPQ